MKKIYALLALLILVGSYSAFGQKTERSYDDGPYRELVDKLKGGTTTIDFQALRIAFTKTKGYSPYGSGGDALKAAFAAIDQKNYKDAVKKAEEILKDNYIDMDAHIAASLAYGGAGDSAKAAFHKAVYLGLVNSILGSGDGKSAKTGYVVIATHEEYVTLRALGLGMSSQSLVNKDGHTFDVLKGTDPKTNAAFEIWFNIDISWKAETDIFK